jgi:outer membrane protein assembly factor BamB
MNTDTAGQALTAFDAATGAVLWQVPATFYASWTPPAIDAEGNLYFCAYANGTWKQVLRSVTADGQLRWESTQPVGRAGKICIGPDGSIYAYGEETLLCFDCQGGLRWAVRLSAVLSASLWEGALVVDAEGVVYIAGWGASVMAYDSHGNRLFMCEIPGLVWHPHAMAIPAPGRLLVVDDPQLTCIE